jgi:hypothetical protein
MDKGLYGRWSRAGPSLIFEANGCDERIGLH